MFTIEPCILRLVGICKHDFHTSLIHIMLVKTKKKHTKQLYLEEDLLNAVHAVRIHEMTFRAAEEYYKVSLSTIYHRVNGEEECWFFRITNFDYIEV